MKDLYVLGMSNLPRQPEDFLKNLQIQTRGLTLMDGSCIYNINSDLISQPQIQSYSYLLTYSFGQLDRSRLIVMIPEFP